MDEFPGLNWGLVAMVTTPEALQRHSQDLYYNILPLLGVNRNIGEELRTLPERCQGLVLPEFEVYTLSKKVHFFSKHGTETTPLARYLGPHTKPSWLKWRCIATYSLDLGRGSISLPPNTHGTTISGNYVTDWMSS